MKKVLPEKCSFCNSKDVKQSQTYPSDYFCQDCKHGGPMLDQTSEKRIYESPDPFSIIVKDENGNIVDIVTWEI